MNVLLFSGRRSCAGEGLARAMIYLIVANLVQRFNINLPPGAEPPSTEPADMALILESNDYKVRMTARK